MPHNRSRVGLAIAVLLMMVLTGCAKNVAAGGGGSQQAGCALEPSPPAAPPSSSSQARDTDVDASDLKVGLAFDIGGRGDASFNDSAARGVDRAVEELGVKRSNVREVTAATGESQSQQTARLRQLAADGYDPIVTVGFVYSEPVATIAKEFPDTRFAIVDGNVTGVDNVHPLLFAEQQGAFLMGVIAALKTNSCTVGFVGGVDNPLIQKWEAGYTQGAHAAARDIRVINKYISPAGDNSGFNDPDKARQIAQGMISDGADVIFHGAGASGKGVFAAAKEAEVMAIGTDSDQYQQKTAEPYKEVIISSMLKRVDVSVFRYIIGAARGDVSAVPNEFDLSDGGVGYATSGGRIDDITDILDAWAYRITEGEIEVRTRPEDS